MDKAIGIGTKQKNAIDIMHDALAKSWSRRTSSDPEEWTREVPAYGQCAVTALVVQYYLGGVILRCPMVGGGSHYWNVFPGSFEADFTSSQFDKPLEEVLELDKAKEVSRAYILRTLDTRLRHNRLAWAVKKYLEETNYLKILNIYTYPSKEA